MASVPSDVDELFDEFDKFMSSSCLKLNEYDETKGLATRKMVEDSSEILEKLETLIQCLQKKEPDSTDLINMRDNLKMEAEKKSKLSENTRETLLALELERSALDLKLKDLKNEIDSSSDEIQQMETQLADAELPIVLKLMSSKT